jgi:large subunit ribosomal protein L17
MACSLIEHKRINTTLAKAKVLRKFVEPILTKSKTDSTHSRRLVFSELKSKDAVSELFRDVAPKIANREGGYTRIIKLGNRLGDAAEMCMIELVDFNELLLNDTKTKTRRSRRGGKKGAGDGQKVAAAETKTTEEVKETPQATTAAPEAEKAEAEKAEAADDETKNESAEETKDDSDKKEV